MERAARVMLTEIHRYLQGGTKLERVVVCLRGEEAFETLQARAAPRLPLSLLPAWIAARTPACSGQPGRLAGR